MRYGDQDRESENVEDRRGQRIGFPRRGGLPIPVGRGGMSLTTLLILGAVLLMLGINPLPLLFGTDGAPGTPDFPPTETARRSPIDIPGLPGQPPVEEKTDELSRFVRRVLADTEDVWDRLFKAAGRDYRKPTLVLFSGGTRSACGTGVANMGPFYCPLDRKVYIDLDFYRVLKNRFGAPGDFAQAYVIAHEVGHHVQTLLGISDKVQAMKARSDARQANAIQVRMELQADCLAGVWASVNDQLKNRLEPGDIEEGLRAAAAIGDDTLQRRTQGYVVHESFTHGSSAQRVRWFKRGLDSGQTRACDTFNAEQL
ncbi:MAG TPA: neutral zinc metallopeptidase [Hyphomicrobiaceae bacterium]|nr:neutral zinc metallopeptidase [Hyphomicrobiaceae bacterium]